MKDIKIIVTFYKKGENSRHTKIVNMYTLLDQLVNFLKKSKGEDIDTNTSNNNTSKELSCNQTVLLNNNVFESFIYPFTPANDIPFEKWIHMSNVEKIDAHLQVISKSINADSFSFGITGEY